MSLFATPLLGSACALCGSSAAASVVCNDCEQDLPRTPAECCPQCGVKSAGNAICGTCLKHTPAFDETRYAFLYDFPFDRLLHRYKYGGELALASWLGRALLQRVQNAVRPDVLLVAPLSQQRLRERGFNQAVEIAKPLARTLGVTIDTQAIAKVRHTEAQAALPFDQRRRNVRGAFAASRAMKGQRVAIVDDVMTTGATLNELAQVAKSAGATHVSAWVVARTL